jgi:hypothetical protein
MAAAQPEIQQASPADLDWTRLAQDLNVESPQVAMRRAYEIAAYIAEVERSRDQKLLLKEGSKLYELTLASVKRE